ncbi:hypothetical protein COT49_00635 [candidate division WWE3 bacterium CG08_land_8_20_14_0_20_40_13]|uniref:Nucleotidyl transferase AbiEii/AbiGii toxin family protein n=1 Tax=candidate division WWE3 bacterium CG08_land_8_20_14_0_20_40_13 TaxID=1975084 RepID=A0A2H0XGR2_UNCKA|nr:MAG: hypothetical protein COT49_00635 [candidate division WWE3 bacterium CG08_land_8_20_14_0_20_40_13]
MQYLRPEDTIHKSYLNRLLIEIVDNPILSSNLAFKGGTCAQMLRFLDRFSVDLDFDVITMTDESKLRNEFRNIFNHLGLTMIKESTPALFFQLKYASETGKRSAIKTSASIIKIKTNEYKIQYLSEIDRLANCQTIEAMFANKLVAIIDRYKLHKSIAGRDIYDTHHFFIQGYSYKDEVILERTGQEPKAYLKYLIEFIKDKVTQTIVNEDLNSLLPADKFQQIRKVLIPETLSFLAREVGK